MAKVTILELQNLESQTSAIQLINQNFQALATAIENTFSRDGTTPNTLSGNLDINSNRILNLPEPVNDTEPLRLVDIGGLTGLQLADIADIASQVATDASDAAASAAEAASYVGAASQAPKWSTARTITISGDVTGTSPSWDGSTDLIWTGLTISNGIVTGAKMASGAAISNLGFTPANLTGATFTGEIRLNYTATSLNVDSAGFRGIPVNTQDTNYTFVMDDSGRMVRHTSGSAHAYTIPPNSSVTYPIGTTLVARNVGAGAVTLTRGSGVTLRRSGSSTSANFTLAQWGLATMIQESADTWIVTGTGLS
jgi:hypothetical protein